MTVANGHKPSGAYDGYINFSDAQLIEVFAEKRLMLRQPKEPKAQKARALF